MDSSSWSDPHLVQPAGSPSVCTTARSAYAPRRKEQSKGLYCPSPILNLIVHPFHNATRPEQRPLICDCSSSFATVVTVYKWNASRECANGCAMPPLRIPSRKGAMWDNTLCGPDCRVCEKTRRVRLPLRMTHGYASPPIQAVPLGKPLWFPDAADFVEIDPHYCNRDVVSKGMMTAMIQYCGIAFSSQLTW
jgi:hypothetical protein